MDDKIKAKAQEVRLALLGRLHGTVEFISHKEDELRLLSEAVGVLNQLDPDAHGIGSYGTLLASAQEIAPPGLKLGDVVRVGGEDMMVNRITAGQTERMPVACK